ncbi:MAG: GTPase ObgE [Bacteroidetes bacterium]|nr:GTPase ObgE [Bacteroidota bacterium]
MKFIDETQIYLKAGDGGNGCVAFRREKFVPKGGPGGGDGGNGGSIYMTGDRNINTLLDLRYQKKYQISRAQHGMGSLCHGKDSDDIVIPVPLGTVVTDLTTGKVIAEITEHEQKTCIARGGRGGLGNANFATSTNRAPRYATEGKPGEEREVRVELKLLADVGLVGFPNAGKSTLISAISSARPKIADYPFTTLIPNLGIVYHDAAQSFVMADMPGIIEGAAEGKGLGIQFLKHIERNHVLAFVIPADSPDFSEELKVLRSECRKFSRSLSSKPYVVILSKLDLVQDEAEFKAKRKKLTARVPVHELSAVTETGTRELVHSLWSMISESKQQALEATQPVRTEEPWRP